MNGFATTDELSTKDGQSWFCRGTNSNRDVTALTCVCLCVYGSVYVDVYVTSQWCFSFSKTLCLL